MDTGTLVLPNGAILGADARHALRPQQVFSSLFTALGDTSIST